MAFNMKYTIESRFLPNRTKRRSGIKMPRIGFIVAHDTGNLGSTAANNVNYYKNSANDIEASAHLFSDDKDILECIPALTGTPEKAWHVLYNRTEDNIMYGDDANDIAIGVEFCFGGNINFDKSYDRYVWLLAYLCHHFGLDPAKHITGHEFLDPGRKTDPTNGLKHGGKTFTALIKDVVVMYKTSGGKKVSGTAVKAVADKEVAEIPSADIYRKVTITTASLNVRNGANVTSPIVGTVKKGNSLWVDKLENGMYRLANGKWISANAEYSTFKSYALGTIKVKANSLNIRDKDSLLQSKVTGELKKGKTAKVYSKRNNMYHLGKGKWISAGEKYLEITPVKKANNNTFFSIGTIVILAEELTIRKGPSFNTADVGTLKKGAKKKVYEIKSGLYRIGSNKWVSAGEKYVKFTKK